MSLLPIINGTKTSSSRRSNSILLLFLFLLLFVFCFFWVGVSGSVLCLYETILQHECILFGKGCNEREIAAVGDDFKKKKMSGE